MVLRRVLSCIFSLVVAFSGAPNVQASKEPCNQSLIDKVPPATTAYIYPRVAVQPFYQWQNNYGYCGEVSLLEAMLNNGEWMSQYDVRLVCGSGLGQTGAPVTANAYSSANGKTPNYNVQVLFASVELRKHGVDVNVCRECAAGLKVLPVPGPSGSAASVGVHWVESIFGLSRISGKLRGTEIVAGRVQRLDCQQKLQVRLPTAPEGSV